MYDQLAVLSPVMLALTAATPVLKGRLVDTEVRWDTIAGAVDDRRPAELGLLDHDAVRWCFRIASFEQLTTLLTEAFALHSIS